MIDQSQLPSTLPTSEVHVCFAHLSEMVEPISIGGEYLDERLSQEEIEKAQNMRSPEVRHRFLASRLLLRFCLRSYIGKERAREPFLIADHGKLSLPHGDIEFNLSHSGDRWIGAFAKRNAVGVDLELPRKTVSFDLLVERFFSDHEKQQFKVYDSKSKEGAFFRGWTRKEAFIKATGLGMSLPLDSFSVSLARTVEQRNLLLEVTSPRLAETKWHLSDVSPSQDVYAAVALEGEGLEVKTFHLKDSCMKLKLKTAVDPSEPS